jgi:ArsR family transcriptional regulator
MGSFDLNDALTAYLPPCNALADLGCGTGDFLARAAVVTERTIGVDSSAKMLEQARHRFKIGNGSAPELRLGELEHLPIRDGEVDCVTISMALHHLTTPQAALAEAFRILTGNGTVVVADLDKHTNEEMRDIYGDRWLGFTTAEMQTFFDHTGFNLLEYRSFPLQKGLVVTLYKAQKVIKGD